MPSCLPVGTLSSIFVYKLILFGQVVQLLDFVKELSTWFQPLIKCDFVIITTTINIIIIIGVMIVISWVSWCFVT